MGKDPAVLFYTGDFIVGTMTMDYEQKGKYIQLLCLQHQNGHLSEKQMLLVCGNYDEDIFSKFEKDDDGKYYNERMEEESIKRRKFTESRRNNRSKVDNENTCVYLIFDPISGNTKIGSSNNPERRLVEIKNQNQNEFLYIIAFVSGVPQTLEKELHDIYKSKNVVNEWYSLTEKEICQIISSNHMIVVAENHMISHMENENENINEDGNINVKKVIKKTKKAFIPPTFEQVLEYAKERGREDLAKKFYDYFTAGEWVDSKGKKVERWKAKFITWENNTEKPKEKEIVESSFEVDDFFAAAMERTYGGKI
jgi:hypothetical protein